MGSFIRNSKPIYQKIMKFASIFATVTIALVNGKPQFPGFGPVGPGPVGPGPVGPGPIGPGPLVRPAPITYGFPWHHSFNMMPRLYGSHGPAPVTYGFPVCPDDVCTACEEEGVTDMKAILEINCQDGIEEDCYAASKECQKSTKECYEPLKDCTCHIDPLGDGCTKECLIGPGPCIRDAEIEIQKCLSEVAEETTKCVREQEITIAKCANDKRAKIAKAEECLACAPGCEKDEEK